MTIYALLASYNRAVLTKRAVQDLFSGAKAAKIPIVVTLADDGSTDGTVDVVSLAFPETNIIPGSGSDYWAKSMQKAESYVRSRFDLHVGDYILWVNDDILLDSDAIPRLFDWAKTDPDAIWVASMRPPDGAGVSYGGLKRSGVHPLAVRLETPGDAPKLVDTFNGNLVAIPKRAVDSVDGIDGNFAHALADIDYGMRARKLGEHILLAPKTFGVCARNKKPDEQSLIKEWKHFTSVKGGGHRTSMVRYLRRHAPMGAHFYSSATYLKWWATGLTRHTLRLHDRDMKHG